MAWQLFVRPAVAVTIGVITSAMRRAVAAARGAIVSVGVVAALLLSLTAQTVFAQSGAGIITTVAGGGPADGTPATLAGIPQPYGLSRDHLGNLYFSSWD